MRIAMLLSILSWLLIAVVVTGCSFHVGIDYQGKTGISDHRYTDGGKDGKQR